MARHTPPLPVPWSGHGTLAARPPCCTERRYAPCVVSVPIRTVRLSRPRCMQDPGYGPAPPAGPCPKRRSCGIDRHMCSCPSGAPVAGSLAGALAQVAIETSRTAETPGPADGGGRKHPSLAAYQQALTAYDAVRQHDMSRFPGLKVGLPAKSRIPDRACLPAMSRAALIPHATHMPASTRRATYEEINATSLSRPSAPTYADETDRETTAHQPTHP